MARTHPAKDGPLQADPPAPADELWAFACPNPECDRFNVFAAGNLSVAERMGKAKHIRRLYCNRCGKRFSERQGSLLEYTKLPEPAVVRIVKCLGHGCSVEATADICEVDPRSVERVLATAGPRAQRFHRLELDKLKAPVEAVQLDELHARVAAAKKGGPQPAANPVRRVGAWVRSGCTRPWRWPRAS